MFQYQADSNSISVVFVYDTELSFLKNKSRLPLLIQISGFLQTLPVQKATRTLSECVSEKDGETRRQINGAVTKERSDSVCKPAPVLFTGMSFLFLPPRPICHD